MCVEEFCHAFRLLCYFMACFWLVLFVNTHTEFVLHSVSIYFRNQLLFYGTKYVSMRQAPIYNTVLNRNRGAIRSLERVSCSYG
jgi:hypothetical protein